MRGCDSDDIRIVVSSSHADCCFIGGVSSTLMLAVIFITRSAITAIVVDPCAMLPLDEAPATGSPINDHDSVRPVTDAIVSCYRTGRRRRLVCIAKWVDARRRVRMLTGPPSRMCGGSRTSIAILRPAHVARRVDAATTLVSRPDSGREHFRQRARATDFSFDDFGRRVSRADAAAARLAYTCGTRRR